MYFISQKATIDRTRFMRRDIMVRRLIACTASDFARMDREDLLRAIYASEGRTILSEVNAHVDPVPFNVTCAEIARAFGSDLILLNKFDILNPKIGALPETDEPIKLLKELVGKPIGVNLEPVTEGTELMGARMEIPEGRRATAANFQHCQEQGYDMILLTGNPGSGVSNESIIEALKIGREHFDGVLIAGKMHKAGVDDSPLDKDTIDQFINSGADIILFPAAGTLPGITIEALKEAIDHVKGRGKLAISAIGTSQEASSVETIKQIGLWNKMAGADIHHIGATGYAGMAPYENIYHLSLATRGLRHTVHAMAASVKR